MEAISAEAMKDALIQCSEGLVIIDIFDLDLFSRTIMLSIFKQIFNRSQHGILTFSQHGSGLRFSKC